MNGQEKNDERSQGFAVSSVINIYDGLSHVKYVLLSSGKEAVVLVVCV